MLIRALLIVEPARLRKGMHGLLREAGVLVLDERDPGQLWERLGQDTFDLVVLTRSVLPRDPEVSLQEIRDLPNRPEIIVLLDPALQEQRARLQSHGAFAVVDQDLAPDAMRETFQTLLTRFREISVGRLTESRRQHSKLEDFSSESPAMQRLLELARRVADSDTSLLILGETGVGKEWLARAIHAEGPRGAAPFIAVNCAAVPDTLLESELFGHEKGAFTGAIRARRGCFELAHRGTLFLDEVADIPVHLQVKLLRALQERKIQRLGAERPTAVDVRIMAATNQDLERALDQGDFRADLYYRLSVVTLTVPPLRERPEDIVPLVENYMAEFRLQLGRLRIRGIEEKALAAMLDYQWPGNVRELINVVERAVLLCDERIVTRDHLPDVIVGESDTTPEPGELDAFVPDFDQSSPATLIQARQRLMQAFEVRYLTRLLRETSGSIGRTARIAGVDPRTIYNKMKSYGLDKWDYREKGR